MRMAIGIAYDGRRSHCGASDVQKVHGGQRHGLFRGRVIIDGSKSNSKIKDSSAPWLEQVPTRTLDSNVSMSATSNVTDSLSRYKIEP